MSKVISIAAKPTGRHQDIYIKLKDQQNPKSDLDDRFLGLVQALKWEAKVGKIAKCKIETLMTEADLEVALEDAEIAVRIKPTTAGITCSACRKKNDKLVKKIMKKVKENKG